MKVKLLTIKKLTLIQPALQKQEFVNSTFNRITRVVCCATTVGQQVALLPDIL